MQPTTAVFDLTEPTALDLVRAVANSVRTPMSALRATLESLANGVPHGDDRRTALQGAVREVERLAREVQVLCDWTSPPELFPCRCTLDEIARTALTLLSEAGRARTQLALTNGATRIDVDGARLARSIALLVDDLRSPSVKVTASASSDRLEFQVDFEHDHECDEAHALLRLAYLLARRDIARMGGRVEARLDPAGRGRLQVHVPLEQTRGDA